MQVASDPAQTTACLPPLFGTMTSGYFENGLFVSLEQAREEAMRDRLEAKLDRIIALLERIAETHD